MLEAKFSCFSTNCKIKSSAPQVLFERCLKACESIYKRWNFYDPASALSELNRSGKMHLESYEIAICEQLLALFDAQQRCRDLSEQAQNADSRISKNAASVFNPAIGALKLGAKVDLSKRHFWLDGEFLHADCALDFGGVMKEAAVDLCAAILAEYSFIVNFGGDIRTNNALSVFVKNPQNPAEAIAKISLAQGGGALCTSANYERAGHIIGACADLASASVWANASDFLARQSTKHQAPNQSLQECDFASWLCLFCGIFSTQAMLGIKSAPEHFQQLFIDEQNHLNQPNLGLFSQVKS